MIAAGRLDRRINIQRVTEGRDPTYGAVTETWADWKTGVPAGLTQSTGREFLNVDQPVSERRKLFLIRYIADLTFRDRVVFESANYDIKDIREIGRRRFQEVQCEATA
ncbi:phage head closure protein [Mesorhizobium sp. WSM3876]|uniref:phage head closure protein n=1 Tax=Mesorhizobium sp. WSM3876 TaxID=422277 RepID=UPI000BB0A1F4|nr:phage head closure protein [Mesorhizobium sp. WSM3876]PBB85733.1 head-tail adaptor protein [Mesorhizobium sp. WSM3876]